MRIAFTATGASFVTDDALACGVTAGDQWLLFQRDPEDADEDWGVHLEYCDQANSDYECVTACRLGPAALAVDLLQDLGALAGVTGFDVTLQIPADEYALLRDGLRRVFRGCEELLTMDAG